MSRPLILSLELVKTESAAEPSGFVCGRLSSSFSISLRFLDSCLYSAVWPVLRRVAASIETPDVAD